MSKVIIKHRLFTWFEETEDPAAPGGVAKRERIANLGDEIDLQDKVQLERGKRLGAFYTDAEAKAIKGGSYKGADAGLVLAARGQAPAPGASNKADGEHGGLESMDAPQLAEYIKEHKLKVDETVALAGDDLESIQKVLDAENIATNNDARAGVVSKLEAKLEALDD